MATLRSISLKVLVLVLVVALLPVRPAAAGTVTIRCYPDWLDRDGDGYAVPQISVMNTNDGTVTVRPTTPVELTVDESKKMVCPSGYVNYNTDCNDNDPAIHPFAEEVAFNGIDDNCDGRVDEAKAEYSATGNGNTTDGFVMRVLVKDLAIVQAGRNLYVEVEHARLANSVYSTFLPKTAVATPTALNPYVVVNVTGLAPFSAYRARVRFYRSGFAGYIQVGGESDWYYTTTDGSTSVNQARTKILLRGFKEYDESQRGRVGYRGTVQRDGTRYGASTNERWCSEFYVWVTKPYLNYLYLPTNVAGVIGFFQFRGEYYAPTDAPTLGNRGDYMPVNNESHSTMLLAVDRSNPSSPRLWTLEGNSGNRVNIDDHPLSYPDGLGHVTTSTLK
jgi:hypothetical protein